MEITIKDILKGTKPGRMQTVGYMQIIPLVSDLVDDNFAMPNTAEIGTAGYGSMVVKNTDSEFPMILPFGAGFIVKQAAQDHATPSAKVIKKNQQITINNAACIQESQGGHIKKGQHEMTILPWSIKEMALETKEKEKYDKLWPAIRQFNTSLGLMDRGHLEDFVKKFKDDLDEFLGQFEVVHKQVGAIILMNGIVAGIERAPNYRYWKELWAPLIREGYGSLAVQYAKKFGDVPPPPKTRVPLKSVGINSLEDIRKALNEAQSKETEITKGIIKKFISKRFTRSEDEIVEGLSMESINHNQFTGQIVRDSDKIVYASLITKGGWMRNKDWHEADDFEI
jgi:hypothetical protein